MPPPLQGVLESCLYVDDLEVAEAFYRRVLGADPFLREPGRHVFMRMGASLVFLFRPEATQADDDDRPGIPVPNHGAHGPGHIAWGIAAETLADWRAHLAACEVPLEQEIKWPNGARSLYFRDPDGNSLELATRTLWARVLDGKNVNPQAPADEAH